MKTEATTETEMREEKVPWPKTAEELMEYIESLSKVPQDYGTAVYVMSMAATAAFYYASHIVGATGFQASCSDMDILRRTRHMEGPFKIVDYADMLYPQYTEKFLASITRDTADWLQKEAKKKLAKADNVHPKVMQHWQRLAANEFPIEVKTD